MPIDTIKLLLYICKVNTKPNTMTRKSKRIIATLFITLSILGLAVAGSAYHLFFAPQFHPEGNTYIYIDRDDTADSVYHQIQATGASPTAILGFKWMAHFREYPRHLHTGRYVIKPGDDVYHLFSRLFRGYQSPINLTIGAVRTLDRIAQSAGRRLMIDSAEVAQAINDTTMQKKLGYTPRTMPCLFIPNTYEVYWNITPVQLIERMQKEHDRFWNKDKLRQAESIGLTPVEVCTLASIVDEETNNRAEKPMVAGLYLNRLHINMPLQADPTVKFAVGDFTLRRITNAHLRTESPYNTYLYAGLPPGPIRIASTDGIEAVLNATKHSYLYMCAKEDFSGTHNFAATLSEHNRNARKYWKALNERKIFK